MSRFEYEVTERHANPMGTLHDGSLCTSAGSAMGMAYARLFEAGESFTTLDWNKDSAVYRRWPTLRPKECRMGSAAVKSDIKAI